MIVDRIARCERRAVRDCPARTGMPQPPDAERTAANHLYVSEIEWATGVLDGLHRLVADGQVDNVAIVDPDGHWLYHPYDGGMDVILSATADRGALRGRHRDWLSAHNR
jgi:hypothetical protein